LAENQCLLTSEGIKVRDELCELLFGKTERIYTQLSSITGLDRGTTITKIMGKKAEGVQRTESIQKISIEQFFQKLINHLQEKWDSGGVRDQRAKKYLQNFNISACWEEEKVEGALASSRCRNRFQKSMEQQMAEAFLLLDYSEQISLFCDRYDLDRNPDLIAIQVHSDDENPLQQLIVKRLSQYLVGGEPYRIIPITITRDLRHGGIQSFWSRIAPYFDGLESQTPDKVIEAICARCTTQPILFILYDFPKMSRHINSFMQQFWYPLVKRLAEELMNPQGKRILLLLSGNNTWSDDVESLQHSPCILPVWDKITATDIKEWLQETNVRQLKNRSEMENVVLSLGMISSWGNNTYSVLDAMELICQAFSFQPELNQFKEYWQLSGELVV
jgi:hypothetical protein